jgi:hypothetical protein
MMCWLMGLRAFVPADGQRARQTTNAMRIAVGIATSTKILSGQ